MRGRSVRVAAAAFATASALAGGVRADPAPIRLEEALFQHLVPVDRATYEELRGLDPALLDDGVLREQVLAMTLEVGRAVLDELIAKGWGALHWFAHPGFRSDPRVVYLSKDVLTVLEKEYVVPTIFPPSGRTRADLRTREGIVPAGTYFEADGMVLGRGRLAVWYPLPPYIRRTDPPYDFRGGRYDLHRLNIADIASPPRGGWALDRLRGRNGPRDAFSGIGGPFRLPIRRIDLASGSARITVWATFGIRVRVEHPRFARRTPPLYARPPEEVGVPADVLERARELAGPGAVEALSSAAP